MGRQAPHSATWMMALHQCQDREASDARRGVTAAIGRSVLEHGSLRPPSSDDPLSFDPVADGGGAFLVAPVEDLFAALGVRSP